MKTYPVLTNKKGSRHLLKDSAKRGPQVGSQKVSRDQQRNWSSPQKKEKKTDKPIITPPKPFNVVDKWCTHLKRTLFFN